jgi:FAD/FMN-containing dehydrogenase
MNAPSTVQEFEEPAQGAARTDAQHISSSSSGKKGLRKDVTDMFLNSLPGLQKEGCHSLITSTCWIVHRQPVPAPTACLEFFGNDVDTVARAISEVVRVANSRSGEGFVAVQAEARKKFWLDQKKTAAISRHTNAFKINEVVVIPLPRVAAYTNALSARWCDGK